MKNQPMNVKLGKFGNVAIGHITKLGSADEILAIGNQIREEKVLCQLAQKFYIQQ